jgi:hypothetical protein
LVNQGIPRITDGSASFSLALPLSVPAGATYSLSAHNGPTFLFSGQSRRGRLLPNNSEEPVRDLVGVSSVLGKGSVRASLEGELVSTTRVGARPATRRWVVTGLVGGIIAGIVFAMFEMIVAAIMGDGFFAPS